jgi:hypothetical protein
MLNRSQIYNTVVLEVAERDERSLTTCIEQGGIVVAVSPHAVFRKDVEGIFLRYQAAQDSETATDEHERTTSVPSLRWRATFGCA